MKISPLSTDLSENQTGQIRQLLESVNWNKNQIDGQIHAMQKFQKDSDCVVLFGEDKDEFIGYISAQFYPWNKLGQIHGLVINPKYRRKGLASRFINEIEAFMKAKQARGVYVDTPVNNLAGCNFYKALDYKQAYIMPDYYDKDLDGVTFLKLFES